MVEKNTQTNDCIDYLELNVTDIERAKEFFGGVFGWKFVDYGETYCEFTDGRMKGGFTTLAPVNLGGPLIVLFHDNLELVRDRIVAAGGRIAKDVFQFPGGERLQFTDPEGYELAVWRHTKIA